MHTRSEISWSDDKAPIIRHFRRLHLRDKSQLSGLTFISLDDYSSLTTDFSVAATLAEDSNEVPPRLRLIQGSSLPSSVARAPSLGPAGQFKLGAA